MIYVLILLRTAAQCRKSCDIVCKEERNENENQSRIWDKLIGAMLM